MSVLLDGVDLYATNFIVMHLMNVCMQIAQDQTHVPAIVDGKFQHVIFQYADKTAVLSMDIVSCHSSVCVILDGEVIYATNSIVKRPAIMETAQPPITAAALSAGKV